MGAAAAFVMPDTRPFYFIINPNAGLGIRGFTPVATRLKELNVPYYAAATTGSGDARMLAHLARHGDFRAIVCHGGDGTMNEIVNGLATPDGNLDSIVSLGLIPSGTAQDIARGLDLPRARMAALDRLLDGKETTLDVGRIRFADGRLHFFVNNFGAGFDAEVAERAQDVRGAISSIPAHVFGFASTLAVYRNKTITLAIEGRNDTACADRADGRWTARPGRHRRRRQAGVAAQPAPCLRGHPSRAQQGRV
jgi:diacylglycerol kinase family enzyme